jgi:hypothetical protein
MASSFATSYSRVDLIANPDCAYFPADAPDMTGPTWRSSLEI